MPRSASPELRHERGAGDREEDELDAKRGESSRRDRRSERDERDRDKDRSRRDRHRERGDERDGDGERRKDRDRRYDEDRERDRERRRRERSRSRDRERDRERDRSYNRDKKRKESVSVWPTTREQKLTTRSRSPSPGRIKRKEARSSAKATAKATLKRDTELEQSRALAEVSMYSAADNPFHDANLSEAFVWGKKREKEKKAGLSADDIAAKDARRRIEAKEELERLNKRRADREVEMALREQEEIKMKRLAEDAQMAEWIAKEDDFQLEQSRRRAGIRLREQRAKAIDFLAINLRFADARAIGRHTAAIGALANPRKSEVEREEEEEGWGWADAGFEFEIDEPWKIFDVGYHFFRTSDSSPVEPERERLCRAGAGHQNVLVAGKVADQHGVLGGELPFVDSLL